MGAVDMIDGVYVALDTTGLPNKIPGWEPRMIALGVALVEGGAIIDSLGGLIQQPAQHLRDPRAGGAWKVSGLTPEDVLESGQPEGAALLLISHVHGAYGPVRGFNNSFLQHFLPTSEAGFMWGRCVMEDAAQRIMGPTQERIGLVAALQWALEEGHDVSAPTKPHHRAHGNAVRVAKLAIALEQEKENRNAG